MLTLPIKPMSLIKFDIPKNLQGKFFFDCPFKQDDVVLYLGEIEGMQGHIVVATRDGRVVWGYEANCFTLLSKDEM